MGTVVLPTRWSLFGTSNVDLQLKKEATTNILNNKYRENICHKYLCFSFVWYSQVDISSEKLRESRKGRYLSANKNYMFCSLLIKYTAILFIGVARTSNCELEMNFVPWSIWFVIKLKHTLSVILLHVIVGIFSKFTTQR